MANNEHFFVIDSKKKKILLGLQAGFIIALVLVFLYISGFLADLEFVSADWRRKNFGGFKALDAGERFKTAASGEVVYIDLDQGSIDAAAEYNGLSWPWPREAYGIVLDYVLQGGARAVVFDLFMDTPGVYGDQGFASSLAKTDKAVLANIFHRPDKKADDQDEIQLIPDQRLERFALDLKTDNSIQIIEVPVSISTPTDVILENTSWLGDAFHYMSGLDRNVTRKNCLLVKYGERYYPSLALAAILAAYNTRQVEIKNKQVIIGAGEDKREIYLDKDGYMWIKFYGPSRSYQKYPIYDIITSSLAEQAYSGGDEQAQASIKVAKEQFKDKIVIIHATALGLKDIRSNPFSDNDPGGHFHGSAIDTIIQQDFIRDLYDYKFVIPLILILAFIFALLGAIVSPKYSFIIAAGSFFSYYCLAVVLYVNNILIETAAVILAMAIAYVAGLALNLAFERKQKGFIQGAFSQFLASSVINKLLKDPSHLMLGGEEKELTIFFSDLAGFTSLSEQLTPAKLVEVLNIYLTAMADIIVVDHVGYVDKYEGDAIMAFWGAPLDDHNHAARACLAALENQEKLTEIQQIFKDQGIEGGLSVRIGINTGKAVVGMMGSEKKLNYTVIGDAVNLASRLEGANKIYNSKIMISEQTYLEAKDLIEARELDLIRVKGKQEPTKVYELMAKKGRLSEDEKKLLPFYNQGLALYREQRWDEASANFRKALLYNNDDGPSMLYLKRCKAFKQSPPPANWDGVFVMKTK